MNHEWKGAVRAYGEKKEVKPLIIIYRLLFSHSFGLAYSWLTVSVLVMVCVKA